MLFHSKKTRRGDSTAPREASLSSWPNSFSLWSGKKDVVKRLPRSLRLESLEARMLLTVSPQAVPGILGGTPQESAALWTAPIQSPFQTIQWNAPQMGFPGNLAAPPMMISLHPTLPFAPPANDRGFDQPTPPGEDEGEDRPTPPSEDEGEDQPTPPGEDEGEDQPTPPGEDEGEDRPTPPGEDEGEDRPTPPGEDNDENNSEGDNQEGDDTSDSDNVGNSDDSSNTQTDPPTPPDGDSGNTPPTPPDGDSGNTPPTPPDGDNPGGNPPGGGGGDSGSEEGDVDLYGVLQVDGTTRTYPQSGESTTLTSTTGGENVVLVENSGILEISGVTLQKSGSYTDSDATDFYAVNAVVAAKSGSTIYLSDTVIESAGQGANNLFASGTDSTIYAQNVTIHSSENSSRGLDATYNGTIVASDLSITTEGDHCAALATDRGNGYISVVDSELSTAGNGSPLIYSTGVIEVENVTGTSTGSQIVGMEGLNTVRIIDCDLTGSAFKASEPIANGVIIYQSMSGDSSEGKAVFNVSDSSLTSQISGGAMFYVTNTACEIVVENTLLNYDTSSNYLLFAGGNDGSNGWGTAGSNGATVTFAARQETLAGDISCDGISSVAFYLADGSVWTGAVVENTDYTGNGGTSVRLSGGSTWIVTGDSTLTALSVASGSSIADAQGRTVTIQDASGNVWVAGTSDWTIITDAYDTVDYAADAPSIADLTIDRTAFDEYFAADDSEETLAVPANLTYASAGANRVQLTWNAVANASGYEIAYSMDGAAWETVTVDSTSTILTDLTYGALYAYKVRALSADGSNFSDSAYSAVIENYLCPMDMTSDGKINLSDYRILSASFGLDTDDSDFDPRADIDGSGKVNLSDWLYLSQNYGKDTASASLVYPAALSELPDASDAFDLDLDFIGETFDDYRLDTNLKIF